MPGVKQSLIAAAIAAVFAVTGCTKLQLARFAPPGIIKYEDIASEKPPNPAIQQRVEEFKADSKAQYPVLSQTPGEDDRPEKLSEAERAAKAEELVAARVELETAVTADQSAVDAETAEKERLPRERDALKERIERDTAAANRERKDD